MARIGRNKTQVIRPGWHRHSPRKNTRALLTSMAAKAVRGFGCRRPSRIRISYFFYAFALANGKLAAA